MYTKSPILRICSRLNDVNFFKYFFFVFFYFLIFLYFYYLFIYIFILQVHICDFIIPVLFSLALARRVASFSVCVFLLSVAGNSALLVSAAPCGYFPIQKAFSSSLFPSCTCLINWSEEVFSLSLVLLSSHVVFFFSVLQLKRIISFQWSRSLSVVSASPFWLIMSWYGLRDEYLYLMRPNCRSILFGNTSVTFRVPWGWSRRIMWAKNFYLSQWEGKHANCNLQKKILSKTTQFYNPLIFYSFGFVGNYFLVQYFRNEDRYNCCSFGSK